MGPDNARHLSAFRSPSGGFQRPGGVKRRGSSRANGGQEKSKGYFNHRVTTPFCLSPHFSHSSCRTFLCKVPASCFTGTWICVKCEGCVHEKCGKNCCFPHPSNFNVYQKAIYDKGLKPNPNGMGFHKTLPLHLHTALGLTQNPKKIKQC